MFSHAVPLISWLIFVDYHYVYNIYIEPFLLFSKGFTSYIQS